MNFLKNCLNSILVFVIVIYSMNLFTVIGFANSNDINEEITTGSSNHELIPMIAAKKVALNEYVEVSFDNTDVADVPTG